MPTEYTPEAAAAAAPPVSSVRRGQSTMAATAATRVVVDVDTGIDDAHALLLALRSPALDVLAVTCVAGNQDVDKVLQATFRVLDAADAPADLPVARGFNDNP